MSQRAPAGRVREVIVIGAGIVGLSCAYQLARRDVRVTVLEAGRVGGGASHGNAGWLTPSLSAPIPGPGAVSHALRSLRRRDATISLRPTLSPSRLLWLCAFARNSTAGRHARGAHATARLAQGALASYDRLVAAGVRLDMRDGPLLFAFMSEAAAAHLTDELRLMEAYGYPPPAVIDGAELRRLEPAVARQVVAGMAVAGERFVEPPSVASGLAAALRSMGAEVRERAAVTALSADPERVTVVAGGDRLAADAVVIAAGAGSRRVAALAGVRLPVEGGKGHSLSVPAHPLPRLPIGLWEPKIACTPMRGRLRLTGGMELGGVRADVDERVIAAIVAAAGRYVDGIDAAGLDEAWSGMRPMTPDGLPRIGRVRGSARLYVNTAHATLGVTLGPVSGELLADLVVDGRLAPELAPFSA